MRYILALAVLATWMGCFSIERNGGAFERIAPGNWRGVFTLDDGEKVPVTFDVQAPNQWSFRNGDSALQPDSIRFWGDTVFCYFEPQQAHLKLIYEINLMEGYLHDDSGQTYPIKFLAQSGAYTRFPDLYPVQLPGDIAGDWTLQCSEPQDTAQQFSAQLRLSMAQSPILRAKLSVQDSTQAFALDLEGIVQKEKIYLSGFDGRRVVFLTGSVLDAAYMDNGALRIGHKMYYWKATRN